MMTSSNGNIKKFRVTIQSSDASAFRAAMAHAAFETVDTGERVTTEDGPEGEAVFVVSVPADACAGRRDRVAELLVP